MGETFGEVFGTCLGGLGRDFVRCLESFRAGVWRVKHLYEMCVKLSWVYGGCMNLCVRSVRRVNTPLITICLQTLIDP